MTKKLITLCFSFVIAIYGHSQDPHRFDEEISKFSTITTTEDDSTIVFTGSSSIRMWKTLDKDCNQMSVINTAFGGSHMTDLLFFIDETILNFNPSKVYIYEGDNDIFEGKDPNAIIKTTKLVTEKILTHNSSIEIYYISAKPSPARWQFKNKYESFNTLLKSYCENHPQLNYINIWNPMLNDLGVPSPQIFIADSLHMNRQGYLIWKNVICKQEVIRN